MTCDICNSIELGDVVEHKMNTNVFGIVTGFAGSLIYIRVSPSLATLVFHEWELRVVEDDGPDGAQEEAPAADNVIKVDFTAKQDLRGAKPAGRA